MNERVILVGAGGISNAWLPPIKAEGLQVVAIVDLRREAALAQVAKYELTNAVAFDDLDEALATTKADFVVDLTIPDAHFEVTTKALQAGFHVVGEKPMAATMEQAREMIRVSERTGRLFMTSQSRRYDAKHASVAATVTAGRLGDVTGVNCDFYLGAHFGGFRDVMDHVLIVDMAIHHFDLVRMFTGLDAVSVWCDEFNPTGSWYRSGPAATCVFEMTGGVRFAYRGSWCAEGCHTSWNGDWRVIGTEGTLIYAGDKPPYGQVVASREQPKFNLPLRELEVVAAPVEQTGFHGALREMLTFLREGKRPSTECHDNIKSLAMVHAAVRSSAEGRRVALAEVV